MAPKIMFCKIGGIGTREFNSCFFLIDVAYPAHIPNNFCQHRMDDLDPGGPMKN
jgi:hypothetical protein